MHCLMAYGSSPINVTNLLIKLNNKYLNYLRANKVDLAVAVIERGGI